MRKKSKTQEKVASLQNNPDKEIEKSGLSTKINYILPQLLLQEIEKSGLSTISKHKMIKLCSIILKKQMFKKDYREYMFLSKNYMRKVFSSKYYKEFFNYLKENYIIESNNKFTIGNRFTEGICKGYRINRDLLQGNFVEIEFKERTKEISDIYILPIISSTSLSNNSSIPLSNSTNTNLSMHISGHLFYNRAVLLDLDTLRIDFDRVQRVINDKIENIKGGPSTKINDRAPRFLLNEEIKENSFELKNNITGWEGYKEKDKSLHWCRENDAMLIQDGKKYFIDDLDEYVYWKEMNIRTYYAYQMAALQNKVFYAHRNDTNNRLDHNLTSMGREVLSIIKEDNDLVEIDVRNSQFAIHADWLKQEGWCKYEDVQRYYDMCSNGVLYDELSSMLDIKRETAKQMMMEIAFSSNKKTTDNKRMFRNMFPNVVKHINQYKEMNDSKEFAIKLQKIEADMFVDDLYVSIKQSGLFCLTKHDSFLVKSGDVDKIGCIIINYFKSKDFCCVLKSDDEVITCNGDKTQTEHLEVPNSDPISQVIDNITDASELGGEALNDEYDYLKDYIIDEYGDRIYSVRYFMEYHNTTEEVAASAYLYQKELYNKNRNKLLIL